MLFFKDLDFRWRLYLTVTVAIAGVVVLIFLNYLLMKSVGAATDQIQQSQEALNTRLSLIENETVLNSDAKKTKNARNYLDSILPDPDRLINFPRNISIWAKQAGVDVGFSFIKEAPASDTEPGFTTFVLTSAGSIAGLINFLKSIEGGDYFVQFNQYEIAGDKDSRYTLLVNGEIFSR